MVFSNGHTLTQDSARGRPGLSSSLHHCQGDDQGSQSPQMAALELYRQCKLCRATTSWNKLEFLKTAKESSRDGKVRALSREGRIAWHEKQNSQSKYMLATG